jgi:hypothetical protein
MVLHLYSIRLPVKVVVLLAGLVQECLVVRAVVAMVMGAAGYICSQEEQATHLPQCQAKVTQAVMGLLKVVVVVVEHLVQELMLRALQAAQVVLTATHQLQVPYYTTREVVAAELRQQPATAVSLAQAAMVASGVGLAQVLPTEAVAAADVTEEDLPEHRVVLV